VTTYTSYGLFTLIHYTAGNCHQYIVEYW